MACEDEDKLLTAKESGRETEMSWDGKFRLAGNDSVRHLDEGPCA